MARFDDEGRRRVIDELRAEIKRLEAQLGIALEDKVLARRERDEAAQRAKTAEEMLESTRDFYVRREESWIRKVG